MVMSLSWTLKATRWSSAVTRSGASNALRGVHYRRYGHTERFFSSLFSSSGSLSSSSSAVANVEDAEQGEGAGSDAPTVLDARRTALQSYRDITAGDRRSAVLMLDRQASHDHQYVSNYFKKLVGDGRAKTLHYNIFLRQQRISEALATYRLMLSRGVPADIVTFTTLASKASQARSMEIIERLKSDMAALGVERDVFFYNLELGVLAREGRVDEALELVTEMQKNGVEPNNFTLALSVRVYGSCGRVDDALRLYYHLGTNEQENMRYLTNAALRATLQVGRFEDARAVLDHYEAMLPDHTHREKVPYNAYINALALAGKETEMLDWLERMKRIKVTPNANTYAALVLFYGRQRNLKAVMKYHAEVKLRRLVRLPMYYNHLIYAYSRNGEPERASFYFQTMRQAGPAPNMETGVVMLSHFARLGDFDRISELWDELFHKRRLSLKPVFYHVLFLCYGRIGGGYVKIAWEKMKEDPKCWVDRELVQVVADVGTHYGLEMFVEGVKDTWEKLIQVQENNERATMEEHGFVFRLTPPDLTYSLKDLDEERDPNVSSTLNLSDIVVREEEKQFAEVVPRVVRLRDPPPSKRLPPNRQLKPEQFFDQEQEGETSSQPEVQV